MKTCRLGLVLMVVVILVSSAPAVEPPPLLLAQGAVEKVDKETLTVRPRGADGKFGKSIVLKITGTSKVTTLLPRMQKGGIVVTQKDTDVKELQPKQTIALVYTMVKAGPVLLTAVVQPPADK